MSGSHKGERWIAVPHGAAADIIGNAGLPRRPGALYFGVDSKLLYGSDGTTVFALNRSICRFTKTSTYAYFGRAPEGSAETDEVWTITTIDVNTLDVVARESDKAWTDYASVMGTLLPAYLYASDTTYAYCGVAYTGAGEDDEVWTVTRLLLADASSAGVATSIAWSARESATYV